MSKSSSESGGGKKRKSRLALVDDLTQDHIWKVHFTKLGLGVIIASLVILLFILFWCLVAFTPVRTLVPGYPDEQTRAAAATNAAKIDSLEYEITKWNLYSENLRRVLSGEETLPLDSLFTRIREESAAPVATPALKKSEESLRSDILAAEAKPAAQEDAPRPLEGLNFFTPAPGVVTRGFERNFHPGLDITVPAGSPVHAVLDGTVLLAQWDDEFGYTLVLQHEGDLVSVYRRCAAVTRHGGDTVKAGTPIALTGSASDSGEPQDILRFELWHRGAPVDPALYIHF